MYSYITFTSWSWWTGGYHYVDYISVTQPDLVGPLVTDMNIIPNPAQARSLIELNGTIDDTETGNSNIALGEFTLDGGSTWYDLQAVDGSYDQAIENVKSTLSALIISGVYEVCMRGKDVLGNIGANECMYLAVYDPEAGFVTGGGWIWSPQGAFIQDPQLEGRANFGFVSKHEKGTTVPTGQTEFQFRIADLNFHSSSYDWLVVSGAKAKFKGVGTINGAGNFKFLLTAIDADINLNDAFTVDRFRIKIWYEQEGIEHIVYDNGLLADDNNSLSTTELQGGSIKIHQNK